jgi:hypothetical protein
MAFSSSYCSHILLLTRSLDDASHMVSRHGNYTETQMKKNVYLLILISAQHKLLPTMYHPGSEFQGSPVVPSRTEPSTF